MGAPCDKSLIIWLQKYARSDWLLSGHYVLAMTGHYYSNCRCPRHIQSIFKLDSGHPYGHPCYGQLTAVKRVSADQCDMTVSRAQVYNSLR